MPKVFYTELDIENLARKGIKVLEITENIVLTDMAYEKAGRMGINLVQAYDQIPSAPVRPYISNMAASQPLLEKKTLPDKEDLKQRIHSAAMARLGGQVDAGLLDSIIDRVLKNIGSVK